MGLFSSPYRYFLPVSHPCNLDAKKHPDARVISKGVIYPFVKSESYDDFTSKEGGIQLRSFEKKAGNLFLPACL